MPPCRPRRRPRRSCRAAAASSARSRTSSGAGRSCLLFLMLTPPLLWLGIVYIGSLFALLLQSFFSIDEFSGLVDHEFTLATYGELLQRRQSRHHPAHGHHGGAGDARLGRRRLPDRLLCGALCARQMEGAVLSRRHAAAVVELSGQGLCLEADPRQGRHPHLAARQAASALAARRLLSLPVVGGNSLSVQLSPAPSSSSSISGCPS